MIEIKNVSKRFGDFKVLSDINETVERGQTMVICGPSGSGKSTLLRCVNGLEPYQEGEIIVDGVSLSDPKTNLYKLRENIGMVFQRFELYPHMTVMQNCIEAPLHVKGVEKDQAVATAERFLDKVQLLDRCGGGVELVAGEETPLVATELPLSVLYEDANLLVVDKASGMVVHPARGNWTGTLASALQHRRFRQAGSLPVRRCAGMKKRQLQ